MTCGNISGVVLAGGSNERFGGIIKANSIIGGKRIIDRITGTIEGIFEELIIVTATPDEFSGIRDCKIIEDLYKGMGPLGGIHSAMRNSTKEAIFVFACDMPFLSRKLILRQTGFYYNNPSDAVIPEHENGIEPMHGIYQCELAARLAEHLESTQDYNIRRFLEKIRVNIYTPGKSKEVRRAFTNINTPSEAETANLNTAKYTSG